MRRNRFPPGWDESRVRRVLEHYERQSEAEAVAEDEAAFEMRGQAVMVVPKRLVPEITRLIAGRRSGRTSVARQPKAAMEPAAMEPAAPRSRRG